MNNIKARAQKRITLDYLHLKENPLRGISICQINDHDFYNFVVNVKVLYGPLKNLNLQLKLTLCDKFPTKAPKMFKYSGQDYFKYPIHHHVFTEKICMDLLSDAWMDPQRLGSGWTSAYTFSTILLQLQSFLADPDLPKEWMKKRERDIQLALEQQKKYKNKLIINNKQIIHTWDDPYPPFPKEEKVQRIWGTPPTRSQIIKEKLTCYILKENPLDYKDEDGRLALGYPIDLSVDDFGRLHPIPVPEVLSYQGFRSELEGNSIKLDKDGFPFIEDKIGFSVYGYWREYKQKYSMKTGFGNAYNNWMPIYVNQEHFQRNLKRIQYQLVVMKHGYRGKDNSFHAGIVFEVLPCLLNKLVVYLLDGTVHQSVAAIEAYIHFAKTFREFIKLYKDECQQIIEEKCQNFLKGDEFRCKRSLGDIGEFVQILMIWNQNFYKDRPIMDALFREAMARQILWIIKAKAQAKFKAQDEVQDMNFSFQSQKISVFLFIFVIEVAKSFGRESYLNNLEKDLCIPEEKTVIKFIQKMKNLKKSIKSYQQWFCYLGFDSFSDDNIYERFLASYQLSNEQGYTFEAEIFDFRKKKYYDELKKQQEIEKAKSLAEKEKRRQEMKEKREKQRQERDEKDFWDIMEYNDNEQAMVGKLDKDIKEHDKAKEKCQKSLKQLEKELYEKYFGDTMDDPFAMYKDEKKTKQYEKELKALKDKELQKVVDKRREELQMQEKIDKLEQDKLNAAKDKIEAKQKQREKEDMERQKYWDNINFHKKQQYLMQKRQNQKEREEKKIIQKQKKEEHRQKTNNGLGFDRVPEFEKKEKVKKQKKIKEMVKTNMFYALDDEWQEA